MRTATVAAAGIAGTLVLTVPVVGLVGSPGSGGGGPLGALGPARAAAAGLTPFGDCEELRRWYVDAVLPSVGPWGLGGPVSVMAARETVLLGAPQPAASEDARTGEAVGSSGTGTNVQEAGVDEPDVAKTDGRILVEIRGRRLVVTDVSGGEPVQLGSLLLPRDLVGSELLLDGRTVLVTATRYAGPVWPVDVAERRIAMPMVLGRPQVRMIQVSIEDPSSPRVVDSRRIDGSLVSARLHDGVVRAVVSTGAPDLPFVTPGASLSRGEALERNRRLVRETAIDQWLPSVTDDGGSRPLVGCSDVRHPAEQSGLGLVSVLAFETDDPDDADVTAVTAAGDLVYSSADRLYVATTAGWRTWSDWPVFAEDSAVGVAPEVAELPRKAPEAETQLHAFGVEGDSTTYLASGSVPGFVRDRWSMDAVDGVLRVATAFGNDPWSATENGVSVLEEDGDRLRVVGSLRGLGVDEQIQSVRWFDDLAVLVTFRQVDPLYTVDLSDPTRPRVLGELKIPGFSAYLHPLGGDLLLGVGVAANDRGVTRGAQVSTFDLADLTDVRRVETLELGRRTRALAGDDPRAFTYLPDLGIVATTLSDDWTGRTSLLTLRVAPDGSLTELDRLRLGGWGAYQARALPLGGDRLAVVDGHDVRLVRVG